MNLLKNLSSILVFLAIFQTAVNAKLNLRRKLDAGHVAPSWFDLYGLQCQNPGCDHANDAAILAQRCNIQVAQACACHSSNRALSNHNEPGQTNNDFFVWGESAGLGGTPACKQTDDVNSDDCPYYDPVCQPDLSAPTGATGNQGAGASTSFLTIGTAARCVVEPSDRIPKANGGGFLYSDSTTEFHCESNRITEALALAEGSGTCAATYVASPESPAEDISCDVCADGADGEGSCNLDADGPGIEVDSIQWKVIMEDPAVANDPEKVVIPILSIGAFTNGDGIHIDNVDSNDATGLATLLAAVQAIGQKLASQAEATSGDVALTTSYADKTHSSRMTCHSLADGVISDLRGSQGSTFQSIIAAIETNNQDALTCATNKDIAGSTGFRRCQLNSGSDPSYPSAENVFPYFKNGAIKTSATSSGVARFISEIGRQAVAAPNAHDSKLALVMNILPAQIEHCGHAQGDVAAGDLQGSADSVMGINVALTHDGSSVASEISSNDPLAIERYQRLWAQGSVRDTEGTTKKWGKSTNAATGEVSWTVPFCRTDLTLSAQVGDIAGVSTTTYGLTLKEEECQNIQITESGLQIGGASLATGQQMRQIEAAVNFDLMNVDYCRTVDGTWQSEQRDAVPDTDGNPVGRCVSMDQNENGGAAGDGSDLRHNSCATNEDRVRIVFDVRTKKGDANVATSSRGIPLAAAAATAVPANNQANAPKGSTVLLVKADAQEFGNTISTDADPTGFLGQYIAEHLQDDIITDGNTAGGNPIIPGLTRVYKMADQHYRVEVFTACKLYTAGVDDNIIINVQLFKSALEGNTAFDESKLQVRGTTYSGTAIALGTGVSYFESGSLATTPAALAEADSIVPAELTQFTVDVNIQRDTDGSGIQTVSLSGTASMEMLGFHLKEDGTGGRTATLHTTGDTFEQEEDTKMLLTIQDYNPGNLHDVNLEGMHACVKRTPAEQAVGTDSTEQLVIDCVRGTDAATGVADGLAGNNQCEKLELRLAAAGSDFRLDGEYLVPRQGGYSVVNTDGVMHIPNTCDRGAIGKLIQEALASTTTLTADSFFATRADGTIVQKSLVRKFRAPLYEQMYSTAGDRYAGSSIDEVISCRRLAKHGYNGDSQTYTAFLNYNSADDTNFVNYRAAYATTGWKPTECAAQQLNGAAAANHCTEYAKSNIVGLNDASGQSVFEKYIQEIGYSSTDFTKDMCVQQMKHANAGHSPGKTYHLHCPYASEAYPGDSDSNGWFNVDVSGLTVHPGYTANDRLKTSHYDALVVDINTLVDVAVDTDADAADGSAVGTVTVSFSATTLALRCDSTGARRRRLLTTGRELSGNTGKASSATASFGFTSASFAAPSTTCVTEGWGVGFLVFVGVSKLIMPFLLFWLIDFAKGRKGGYTRVD